MDIVQNFKVNATADKLYNAIGTQQGIEGWWCKDCNIATETGNVSEMRFDKQGTIVEMKFRVEELAPGRIAWTCIGNGNPIWLETTIDFDIKSNGEGSELNFTHGNWDPSLDGNEAFDMVKEGWGHFMGSLKTYCETGAGQPW